MEEGDYDHVVIRRLEVRLPQAVWAEYPAPSVDAQAKRMLLERMGLQVELDVQTTVIRIQNDVLVRIE